MKRRGSGILLHISSLPSAYGVGDLGPHAYKFADFLAESKQSFWQILPLTPTDLIYDNSPYHSISAFAGNPLLISPDFLVRDELLSEGDLEMVPSFPQNQVDYEAVTAYKNNLFDMAYKSFKEFEDINDYERFCSRNQLWLDDFVLFKALREHFEGKVWSEWEPEIRDRSSEALDSLKHEHKDRLDKEKFLQYIFYKQWFALKSYCNQKGIQIIGDIPIYVEYNSAEVWTNPQLFKLDNDKKPEVVAGVPPDYFSETGQLWGSPIYNWDKMREQKFEWWIKRIAHTLTLVDIVRIDHFRGLIAYWEVPAGETTAINGKWVEVPSVEFFNTVLKHFPTLPIIAEDLGIITPDVREVIHQYDLPGMKVLHFAFGDDMATNPYVPHNLIRNCIVYTGTHDNNTTRGWFRTEATPEIKHRLNQYLGREISYDTVPLDLMRLAFMSVANLAIIPIQDLLGLDEQARMNKPSTNRGNWRWRLSSAQLTPEAAATLLHLTETYGRA